jgi:hypothetical protein
MLGEERGLPMRESSEKTLTGPEGSSGRANHMFRIRRCGNHKEHCDLLGRKLRALGIRRRDRKEQHERDRPWRASRVEFSDLVKSRMSLLTYAGMNSVETVNGSSVRSPPAECASHLNIQKSSMNELDGDMSAVDRDEAAAINTEHAAEADPSGGAPSLTPDKCDAPCRAAVRGFQKRERQESASETAIPALFLPDGEAVTSRRTPWTARLCFQGNTRKCCRHFWARRILSPDGRRVAIFVSNFDIVHPH